MKDSKKAGLLKQSKGFTLIELMLVVVIIGILAGISITRISPLQNKVKIKTAKGEIGVIRSALSLYNLDVGDFPTTQEGLDALINNPGDDDWDGPYLDSNKVPKDPWKNSYKYIQPGEISPDYDLRSFGPNGLEGDDDDIGNWEKDNEDNS